MILNSKLLLIPIVAGMATYITIWCAVRREDLRIRFSIGKERKVKA